jgi:hypothetical protein
MVRLLKKSPAKASGGLARRLVLGLLLLSTFTLGGIAVAAWTWSVDASGHDRWVLQAFGHKQRGFFVRLAAAPLDDWWMPLRRVCPASTLPRRLPRVCGCIHQLPQGRRFCCSPLSVSDVLAVSVRARRARSPLLSSNWTGLCVDVVPASTTGSTTTHADSQGCRRDHVEQGHDSRRTLADVLRASNAPSAIDYLAIDATKGGDVVLEVRARVCECSSNQHTAPGQCAYAGFEALLKGLSVRRAVESTRQCQGNSYARHKAPCAGRRPPTLWDVH